ncbi:hypothetical protein S7711_11399 [Stachybotrys chartarum IBT 7711]|uniref:Uncharacterized protein n=1 Tax=Stachybotrys chartarum (strain CBS 109288 / IBT 7711) TaxID=1280523 RepID=A0A084AMN9_STACB|nr:hypothetical protein S7711_11399 [Stachybotrys chartarum IBT 7711]
MRFAVILSAVTTFLLPMAGAALIRQEPAPAPDPIVLSYVIYSTAGCKDSLRGPWAITAKNVTVGACNSFAHGEYVKALNVTTIKDGCSTMVNPLSPAIVYAYFDHNCVDRATLITKDECHNADWTIGTYFWSWSWHCGRQEPVETPIQE